MTTTEPMAKYLAAIDDDGSSKSSHKNLATSDSGSGFSSSYTFIQVFGHNGNRC